MILEVDGVTTRYGALTALHAASLPRRSAASSSPSSVRTAPARPRCCRAWWVCSNRHPRSDPLRRERHHGFRPGGARRRRVGPGAGAPPDLQGPHGRGEPASRRHHRAQGGPQGADGRDGRAVPCPATTSGTSQLATSRRPGPTTRGRPCVDVWSQAAAPRRAVPRSRVDARRRRVRAARASSVRRVARSWWSSSRHNVCSASPIAATCCAPGEIVAEGRGADLAGRTDLFETYIGSA